MTVQWNYNHAADGIEVIKISTVLLPRLSMAVNVVVDILTVGQGTENCDALC